LKSQGKDCQTGINAILRMAMLKDKNAKFGMTLARLNAIIQAFNAIIQAFKETYC
jgi:hypothetical protein